MGPFELIQLIIFFALVIIILRKIFHRRKDNKQ